MKTFLSRFVASYGMLVPLLLLCAFFGFATINDQYPTGESAARQVAAAIAKQFPHAPHVVITAGNHPDDVAFAKDLNEALTASGAKVLAVVRGEAQDAREPLRKIAASGQRLDAIACTQATSEWQVFGEIPGLGTPAIVRPESYVWPDFLKPSNLRNIASQNAIIAIIAIGMTMVIITGGIDLSVGSLIALSAVVAAVLIRDYLGGVQASTAAMILACAAAVLLCGLIGAFTGCVITGFNVPPFIVSLAMMLVASGFAGKLSNNVSIPELPASFIWLGRGADFVGLPNSVVLMAILYVAAHVVMSQMRLGRYLYAVGGNREAARLAGVPVRRVVIFSYIASALLAGLGGVIMASQLNIASATFGKEYELDVIAAVVVGGTSLSGGEGKMFGTLIGALTIAVMRNGMNLIGLDQNSQRIALGFAVLGAVLFDKLRHRL